MDERPGGTAIGGESALTPQLGITSMAMARLAPMADTIRVGLLA